MKKATLDTIIEAANSLLFEMSEEEYEKALARVNDYLNQASIYDRIEGLDEAEEMTFPFDCSNEYLREDECDEPLTQEEVLSNARSVEQGQIRLPKVVR